MPWSRSTSATPAISASVLRRLQPHQHAEQRQVRHDAGEELGVLDLPGHHRLRHAGLLQQADALPELAERDPVQAAPGGRAAAVVQIGKGLFLERDDRHVVPGAAGGVEHQEREPAVAGDQTETHGMTRRPMARG